MWIGLRFSFLPSFLLAVPLPDKILRSKLNSKLKPKENVDPFQVNPVQRGLITDMRTKSF